MRTDKTEKRNVIHALECVSLHLTRAALHGKVYAGENGAELARRIDMAKACTADAYLLARALPERPVRPGSAPGGSRAPKGRSK